MSKHDPILGPTLSEAALSEKHMKGSKVVLHHTSTSVDRHGKINIVKSALWDFHNLSGLVTDIQAGHVVDRLEGVKTAEDKVSPDFAIKVGGVYLNGSNEIVTIVREDIEESSDTRPTFEGDNDLYYFENGSCSSFDRRLDLRPFDPIARIKELESCLRHTRRLVSMAVENGFTETGPIEAIFKNNAAISRLVPIRPIDRLSKD